MCTLVNIAQNHNQPIAAGVETVGTRVFTFQIIKLRVLAVLYKPV
jgi:hypothetical protein